MPFKPEDYEVKPGGYITPQEAGRLTVIKQRNAKERYDANQKRMAKLEERKRRDKNAFRRGLGKTGEAAQRSTAASGYGSGILENPGATYSGEGNFVNQDQQGTGNQYIDSAKEFLGKTRRGSSPTTGSIGTGDVDNPYTGTRNLASGFTSETPVGYVRGAGYNDNNRIFAAHDLYNAEQMAQVDANTRASDQHLAYIDRQEAIKRLENKEKNLFRSGSRYRGLSQRRKAQLSEAGSEQIADLREADLDRSIANDVREVGLANANSARFTGQGQIARANADLAVQQSKEGLELAKLDQEDRQFRLGRTTSPKEAAQFMNNIYKSLGDSFGIVINDPETRALVTSQAMSGMTVQDIAKFLQSQGLNESGV